MFQHGPRILLLILISPTLALCSNFFGTSLNQNLFGLDQPFRAFRQHDPFGFLKTLQGWHKGQNAEELPKLKQFLGRFGYMEKLSDEYKEASEDYVEAALKAFQLNYNLVPTGVLDSKTVKLMKKPRCGNPDIFNGTKTRMRLAHIGSNDLSTLHIVSHYSFFGEKEWVWNKTRLTYKFGSSFPHPIPNIVPTKHMKRIVKRAFNRWSRVSNFTFEFVKSGKSDIEIAFHRRDHNDKNAFDGAGGILGHAFAPPFGFVHYDADEKWSINPKGDEYDFESVAVHEIGHVLGLEHSSVEDAIMFPFLDSGTKKRELQKDDIDGIRDLYNLPVQKS